MKPANSRQKDLLKTNSKEDKADIKISDQTMKFYQTISNSPNNITNRIIDSIMSILTNIIHNPYEDSYRIVDYFQFIKSKIYNYSSIVHYLRDLGFISGPLDSQVLFPYDLPLSDLVKAKETLLTIHDPNSDNSTSHNVEDKVDLPTFQKYIPFFAENLTLKESKMGRQATKLSIEEAIELSNMTKSSCIEEFLCDLILDTENLQNAAKHVLKSQVRYKNFIRNIK